MKKSEIVNPKSKIGLIFLVMSACIMGSIGFQAWWLRQAFFEKRARLEADISAALVETTDQQHLEAAYPEIDSAVRQLLFVQKSGTTDHLKLPENDGQNVSILRIETSDGPPKTAIRINGKREFQSADSGQLMNIEVHSTFEKKAGWTTRSPEFGRPVRDSFVQKVVAIALKNNEADLKIDLQKLDSIYRNRLLMRGIDLHFQLDTVRADLNFSKKMTRGKGIFAGPVPLNFRSPTLLFARFDSPTGLILWKMGGLLAASLVLLSLTVGCFLFMLATILRQKKLAEIKNDFIHNMTHELRTPVATVTAAVEAMENFQALDDPEKTRSYLGMAKSQLARLAGLIDDVLTSAVEENDSFRIQKQPLELGEIIRRLAAEHELRAEKPVEFRFIGFEKPVVLAADAVHFPNAIGNLFDNATKYSGEKAAIEITAEPLPDGLQLTFRDNGIGIENGHLPRIFDQFYRIPTGDRHDVKGFGLGLAYVKKVVERHGGRIRVESEIGRGTVFFIEMPSEK